MIGGKLASYRIFAQELSRPRRRRASSTRARRARRTSGPCPAASACPTPSRSPSKHDADARRRRAASSTATARSRVRILERAARRPGERDVVCPCEPVLEAEVRHVVREELARTVDDVARRTRLGLGACGGMRCAARCGQIVAEERGLAAARGPRDGARVPRAAGEDADRGDGPGAGEAGGADARAPAVVAGRSARVTVVVIGAGVAGTAAALAAARAGARGSPSSTAGRARRRCGPGPSTAWRRGSDVPDDERHRRRARRRSLGRSDPRDVAPRHARVAHGREAGLLDLHALLADSPAAHRCRPLRAPRRGARTPSSAPRAAGLLRARRGRAPPRRRADRCPTPTSPPATTTTHASAWLAERLREGIARSGTHPDGVAPPAVARGRRARGPRTCRGSSGSPCGEAMGLPGGPCGLRFEAARDARSRRRASHVAARPRAERRARRCADGACERRRERDSTASAVVARGRGARRRRHRVPAERGDGGRRSCRPRARPPFACTLDGPAAVGAHGRPLEVPGSLFGVPPEALAWPFARDPLIERVGVLCDEDGRDRRAASTPRARSSPTRRAPGSTPSRAACAPGAAAARDAVTSTAERPSSTAEAPASRP